MKILYIFSHPDDESFGPSAGISAQLRAGHEVHLLTLTKGEATKQRLKLGLSKEEMADVRYKEMLNVQKTLGLTSMTVLDLPDSGLKELDPRIIESGVEKEIKKIKPDIIVTYPCYGVSGFHDHLINHAVVKRVYLQMKDEGADYLKRLAFFTLSEEDLKRKSLTMKFNIQSSPEELIDCKTPIDETDIENMKNGLKCYETYKDTIEETGVMNMFKDELSFEIFGEDHKPVLEDITKNLK
ncbi:MAG TPA: PIG-L family deacetylase [Bacteroidetes bacterium]|nr:PIG-L family deacetylase [Bacteroidota bacterium]HCN36358.1 PIG-L family deacetylase [Bacteroidota bacterium]